MSSVAHEARPRVGSALRTAVTDLSRAWRPRWTLATALWLVGVALPLVTSTALESRIATLVLMGVAAVGLNLAIGLAAMPSIGHGAFVAIGAVVAAALAVHTGLPGPVAVVLAIVAAALAGAAVGAGALRLQPTFVAIASWVGAWLVAGLLDAVPSLSGGSRGVALPPVEVRTGPLGIDLAPTPGAYQVIAVCLLALALLAFVSARSGPFGLGLAAARQNADAARSLGLAGGRRRLQAFVLSAAFAGAAGAVAVELAGVFDATSYGPLLSITLFVAVLLGRRGTTFGPLLGVAVLSVVSLGGPTAFTLSPSVARFGQLIVGAILLGAVAVRRGHPDEIETPPRGADGTPIPSWPSGDPAPRAPGVLRAESVVIRYGGVRALDEVHVELDTGRIHALVGPNGSGKTTLLRVLSGDLEPHEGRVLLGGRDVTELDIAARVASGIVRTNQRTTVFDSLTPLQHIEAALLGARGGPGLVRDLLKTPSARAAADGLRQEARQIVERYGFGQRPAGELSGAEQRFLMIAMATASRPSFLLLDEPSAGMATGDKERLRAMLQELAAHGTGVVVVEHDLRLLRSIADTATVLDAGRVIASGAPDVVLRDPHVVEAYVGRLRGPG
ncbi:MAG TPA: ATP-binding cassette domain-containing protein [Actinomycetota bacterium]|nr:ATP-binding cassette domain-containing protein [Actinomycetota bacterium]